MFVLNELFSMPKSSNSSYEPSKCQNHYLNCPKIQLQYTKKHFKCKKKVGKMFKTLIKMFKNSIKMSKLLKILIVNNIFAILNRWLGY